MFVQADLPASLTLLPVLMYVIVLCKLTDSRSQNRSKLHRIVSVVTSNHESFPYESKSLIHSIQWYMFTSYSPDVCYHESETYESQVSNSYIFQAILKKKLTEPLRFDVTVRF